MNDSHDGPALPDAPPPEAAASDAPAAPPAVIAPVTASQPPPKRPTFVFFGIVAAISLVADVSTKAWAEITLLNRNPLTPSIELVKEHLAFTLAYNPGGAWGLFQKQNEFVRRPFFLLVSLLAIAFIINLYGRLTPQQKALKWGLPLVLGGALGNLSDRIIRSNVIDFIDYQAKWIEAMNRFIAKFQKGWAITDHWPTFNVADIAICVGVGLMAVDMFTARRGSHPVPPKPSTPAGGTSASAPIVAPAPAAAPELGTLGVPESNPPLKPEG